MSAHGHGQKLMKAKKHTLMTSLQVIQHRPLAIRSRNTQHQQTVIGYTPIKKTKSQIQRTVEALIVCTYIQIL